MLCVFGEKKDENGIETKMTSRRRQQVCVSLFGEQGKNFYSLYYSVRSTPMRREKKNPRPKFNFFCFFLYIL